MKSNIRRGQKNKKELSHEENLALQIVALTENTLGSEHVIKALDGKSSNNSSYL